MKMNVNFTCVRICTKSLLGENGMRLEECRYCQHGPGDDADRVSPSGVPLAIALAGPGGGGGGRARRCLAGSRRTSG